jgi:biotin operon repressor
LFEKLGDERFDDGDCGAISRRAIAESTGIPRENVRRIVKELIDEGRIIETTDGHVRQPDGYMQAPGVVEAVNNLVNGMVKTMQHLINLNVVQIR